MSKHIGIELKTLSIKVERINPSTVEQWTNKDAAGRHCCEYCTHSCEEHLDLLRHVLETHPQLGNYKCRYCPKTIVNRYAFLHHERSVHTGHRPFKCSICNQQFTVESYLHKHKRKFHRLTKSLRCSYCPKTFWTQINVAKHESRFHTNCDEKRFECERCSMKFHTARSLRNHVNMVHADAPQHKCTHCCKRFKNIHSMRNHVKKVHKIGYDCERCDGKRFCTKQQLEQHIQTKHPEFAFASEAIVTPVKGVTKEQCRECKLYFKTTTDLAEHVITHYRHRYYPCGLCPKRFKEMYLLQFHLEQHANERRHACDVCGKRFNLQASLKAHSLLHTGVKPLLQCNECDKQVSSTRALENHMKNIHRNERPHSCDKCPRTYTTKVKLAEHAQSHKIRFFCRYCIGFYKTAKEHKEHERLHTDKTGFGCKECLKMYKTKRQLKIHEKLHSKSLSCDMCDKKVSKKIHLIKHMKMHGRFDCEQCGAQFGRKTLLEMHVYEKHLKGKQPPIKQETSVDGSDTEETSN